MDKGAESMNKRTWLIVALVLPMIALVGTAYLKNMQRASGTEVILPIEGFDPRDLLSGHYLTYNVAYGVGQVCESGDGGYASYSGKAAICLKPTQSFYPAESLPSDCTLLIRGECDAGRFNAGIERFYIPEEHAAVLDTKVRDKQGAIVLSVDTNGNAVLKDLLIDGKPWKTAVETGN
jgi:uncharacterized membrane-anchored protein